MIARLDALGHTLDGLLTAVEGRFRSPGASALLGVAMGLVAIVGGLSAFVIVLAVLVNLFA